MGLLMHRALLPYFGNKRELCSIIFHYIAEYLPRELWGNSFFIDAFLGACAMSQFAKAQEFAIVANDIAQRSIIAGNALIKNGHTKIREVDIERLFLPNANNLHFIEQNFVPDVFPLRHAQFLDNAFANAYMHAKRDLMLYLLIKYIISLRPYSKFSSPNAFNIPFENGDFDQIKSTYTNHIKDNLKSPLEILRAETESINQGIFHNGVCNDIYNVDAVQFVKGSYGEVLYLDPPYAGTLAYEKEYEVLDAILGDKRPVSKFSSDNGMDMLEEVLAVANEYPLWVISYGNAGGKNDINDMVRLVQKYRSCDYKEIAYQHCASVASEEHKKKSREWLLIGHKT